MHKIKRNKEGFTLIELLIVIGIIAILAAAVIITITPGERLLDAREATRESHLIAIGQGVHMLIVDTDNAYTTVSDVVTACGGVVAQAITGEDDFLTVDASCLGLSTSLQGQLSGEVYGMREHPDGGRVQVCTTATESDYVCTATGNGGELIF